MLFRSYSLFPSTCTDTFGTKFATTNAGLLYTAKGTAALLVPYTNQIQKMTGSWDMVFVIAAVANILAALLALFVLNHLMSPARKWRLFITKNLDNPLYLRPGDSLSADDLSHMFQLCRVAAPEYRVCADGQVPAAPAPPTVP